MFSIPSWICATTALPCVPFFFSSCLSTSCGSWPLEGELLLLSRLANYFWRSTLGEMYEGDRTTERVDDNKISGIEARKKEWTRGINMWSSKRLPSKALNPSSSWLWAFFLLRFCCCLICGRFSWRREPTQGGDYSYECLFLSYIPSPSPVLFACQGNRGKRVRQKPKQWRETEI